MRKADKHSERADLFEVLRERVGCHYISDLRAGAFRAQAIAALWKMDKGDYPLSVWKDAFHYLNITGDDERTERMNRK